MFTTAAMSFYFWCNIAPITGLLLLGAGFIADCVFVGFVQQIRRRNRK